MRPQRSPRNSLSWPEIARILLHDGAPTELAGLEEAAVRRRKRDQAAKDELRSMAILEGLVPSE